MMDSSQIMAMMHATGLHREEAKRIIRMLEQQGYTLTKQGN